MTRKYNRLFLRSGVAGFAALFLLAALNGVIFKLGYDNSALQSFLNIAHLYIAFASFIALAWFGFVPRFGTRMYLRGDWDHPAFDYMRWGPYRFVFLIVDDPDVIVKEQADK